MSGYHKVPYWNDKSVTHLPGTMSLHSIDLHARFPGHQGAAAAIAAATQAQLLRAHDWNKDTINTIIVSGNELFNRTIDILVGRMDRVDPTQVGPEECEKKFYLGRTLCLVCVEMINRGYIDHDSPGRMTLAMAFNDFFNEHESYPYAVLTCNGKYLAVWTHPSDGDGFVFDPTQNRQIERSVAACFKCERLDALLNFVRRSKQMEYDAEYKLYRVRLLRSRPIDERVERAIEAVSVMDESRPGHALPTPRTPGTPTLPEIMTHPDEAPSVKVNNYRRPRPGPSGVMPVVQERMQNVEHVIANVPSTLQRVDEDGHIWMLLSNMSEQSVAFEKSRCMSAPGQCLVALATIKAVINPLGMLRENIDQILYAGERLFHKMKEQSEDFVGRDVLAYQHARIQINDKKYIAVVDTLSIIGHISTMGQDQLDLVGGLATFFDGQYKMGVLEYGNNTPIALCKINQVYWMFDPRPFNYNGNLTVLDKIPEEVEWNASVGKSAMFLCYNEQALLKQLRRGIDPFQINQPFTIRSVKLWDDVPGMIPWNHFQPLRRGSSWILWGSVHAAHPRFDEANHDRQRLATATMALVASRVTPLHFWDGAAVDRAVIEGDDYYSWCRPRNGENANDDWTMTVSNMRLVVFHQRRKCRLRLRPQASHGKLCHPADANVPGSRTLVDALEYFFHELSETLGIFERTPNDEGHNFLAFWAVRQEVDNDQIEWSYYAFHDHAEEYVLRAALDTNPDEPVESTGSACVIRFASCPDLAQFIKDLFCRDDEQDDMADAVTTGPASQSLQPDNRCFYLHALAIDSIDENQLSEVELEQEMLQSVIPLLNAYERVGPTSGYLYGSQNGSLPKFVHRMEGKQRAAVALAALAMKHICDPFQWTSSTVDTLLSLGDAFTAVSVTEIRDEEPGDEQQPDKPPRDYYLPDEIVPNFYIGSYLMTANVSKVSSGTGRESVQQIVEDFLNNYGQGVFRCETCQMAIWRYDNVYFCLDPRGNEANNYHAGVYYWLESRSLCDFLAAHLEGDNYSLFLVMMENKAPLAESVRPGEPTNPDAKLDWYNWRYAAKDFWAITFTPEMEALVNPFAFVSMCIVTLMFAKIYEPQQWNYVILSNSIFIGNRLHQLNVERWGEDRLFRPYEMISEFYIANRQINLTLRDCVAHGQTYYDRDIDAQFKWSAKVLFNSYSAGILNVKASPTAPDTFWAIWKHDDTYYILFPGTSVVRAKQLQWQIFSKMSYCQFEFTGFDVTNCEFVKHVSDPSPAIKPTALPAINAYIPLSFAGQISDARGILRASCHEENIHHYVQMAQPIRGYQTVTTCLIAVAATLVHEPSMWTQGILDRILIIGFQYHRRYFNEEFRDNIIHPVDTFSTIDMGQTRVDFEVAEFSNDVAEPDQPHGMRELGDLLLRRLSEHYSYNCSCILVIDKYMISIWSNQGAFYLFDPKPRDVQGLRATWANINACRACVIWFGSLSKLIEVVLMNCQSEDAGLRWLEGNWVWWQVRIFTIRAGTSPAEAEISEAHLQVLETEMKRMVKHKKLFIERRHAPSGYHDRMAKRFKATIMHEQFMEIELNGTRVNVLGGYFHEEMKDFAFIVKGYQSTAVAVVMLAIASVHAPLAWTPEVIDYIIENGNVLHAERAFKRSSPGPVSDEESDSDSDGEFVLSTRPKILTNLHVKEVPRTLRMGSMTAYVQIQEIPTAAGTHAGGSADMLRCLRVHFSDDRVTRALLRFGDDFTLAICRSVGSYFFLDPTEKNKAMMPWDMSDKEGGAALFQCGTLESLADTIITLLSQWETWDWDKERSQATYSFDTYTLHSIRIVPSMER